MQISILPVVSPIVRGMADSTALSQGGPWRWNRDSIYLDDLARIPNQESRPS
jgi:hypothetical protein